MSNAVDLSTVTEVESADAFLITSAANGDVRRAPRSVVQAMVSADIGGLSAQYATPASGDTVTVSAGNTWLILAHGSTLATLTIALPTASDGQEVLVSSASAVTSLTVSGTSSGAPTALTAGGFARMRFDGVLSVWRRAG
jgi:hypothetical protein